MATETIEVTDHKLLVAGERLETGEWSEVKSPYDGTVIGRVPKADAGVVTRAIDAARRPFDSTTFPSTSAPPCSTAPPTSCASARTIRR